ncbi:hypothetical protein ACTFIV_003993 [Dictyostelium citrinum]
MVLIKINNIDFTLINKDNLSKVVDGSYDITKNSIALGDLGIDKELIEKVIPIICIRRHGIKLNSLCLLGDFNQEMNIFKRKDGNETLLTDMRELYLMDGFNKPIHRNTFSERYNSLYLYNIGEQVLEMNSLPTNSFGELFLMDGFNQSIIKGMINQSLSKLHIGNIGGGDINKIFNAHSIPNTISEIIFEDGFNQPIFKDLIPKGIEVHLHNIGDKALLPESIPKETKILMLKDGFNQTLTKGLIPVGIKSLYLYNIGPNVFVEGSEIPNELHSIFFCNGYNQPILKGMIPDKVSNVYFRTVGPLTLVEGSIPSTVKQVYFWNDFNIPLTKGIIEEGVEWLETNTQTFVLQVGSIPSSVKTLYLREIKSEISPGVIPNTVENVHLLYFTPNTLIVGSLPNTLKELYLIAKHPQNKFVPGIIPDGVEKLTIHGPLEFNEPKQAVVSKPSIYISPFLPNIIPNTFTFFMTVFKFCLSLVNSSKPPPPTTTTKEEISKISVLEIGSIPRSVKTLHLTHEFNDNLSQGVIPDSVESCQLYNIKTNLEVGSLPNSIRKLRINNEHGILFSNGVIPVGVERLELTGNVKNENEFQSGSIPITVKELELFGFNYPLVKGIIPSSVEKLILYDVGKKTLQKGSVPDTVKEVYLGMISDTKLDKSLFPKDVKFT